MKPLLYGQSELLSDNKNNDKNNKMAEGFFTYVSVGDDERPRPHNIKNEEPQTEEGKRIFTIASNL